jgi:hypothetical protein
MSQSESFLETGAKACHTRSSSVTAQLTSYRLTNAQLIARRHSAQARTAYKRGAGGSNPPAPTLFEYTSACLGQNSEFEQVKRYILCMRKSLCGAWMPRAGTTCARTSGHGGDCMSARNMANRREYRRLHGHPYSPESRKKSNRKYRISSYGLTQEQFDGLLAAQQYACGMCHKPFEKGQLIHVDHDHACCQKKNRSCGRCIRGLLCHVCNIALGHIERRYAIARAYLDSPLVRLLAAA